MKKSILILFALLINFSLWAVSPKVSVEAESPDPTLVVRGPEKEITAVNTPRWQEMEGLFLFTRSFADEMTSLKRTFVAVVVDGQMRVVQTVNGAVDCGEKPAFSEELGLTIPENGFALIAADDSYTNKTWKRFLAENFRKGNVVKLRIDGKVASVKEVEIGAGMSDLPSLQLNQEPIKTVLVNKETLSGKIVNYVAKRGYRVAALTSDREQPLKVNAKGEFVGTILLNSGVNYVDVIFYEGDEKRASESLIRFVKKPNTAPAEVVLWVEQFPNAKVLTNDEAVRTMIEHAARAGFTSIGFDVKGPEGYVSYRKNNLSNSPYFTRTVNPKKRIADDGFDLLESILKSAHAAKLKVYVSFNFFTEGNLTTQDFAVLNEHRHWEEIVQRPEDKGALLAVRESKLGLEAAQGKRVALAFVNPASKEVQDFQLLRVEEVLQNYAVDGIVLDRCRYDNLYADFSPTSRNLFAAYLLEQGKELQNFPNDAFRITSDGTLVQGAYFVEWITFRSEVIKNFTARVREVVNRYKVSKNPNLKLAAYVGSWYEVYYQNGVNWASPSFRYDARLNFPESKIYRPAYYATSYLNNLDFLMIGTYYKTPQEVSRYITLGNILTAGQLPLIGSMSMPDLKVEEQGEVFKASLQNSAGLMIFDNCYVDWNSFHEQMKIAFGKKNSK